MNELVTKFEHIGIGKSAPELIHKYTPSTDADDRNGLTATEDGPPPVRDLEPNYKVATKLNSLLVVTGGEGSPNSGSLGGGTAVSELHALREESTETEPENDEPKTDGNTVTVRLGSSEPIALRLG